MTRAPALPTTTRAPAALVWLDEPASVVASERVGSAPPEHRPTAANTLVPPAPARSSAAAARAASRPATSSQPVVHSAASALTTPVVSASPAAPQPHLEPSVPSGASARWAESPLAATRRVAAEARGFGESGRAPAAEAHSAGGSGSGSAARLLGSNSPCADLFPYAARSDRGTVKLALDVALSGQPLGSHVVDESPRGQGFALAAHHCIRRLRFSPALDGGGHAVASRSVLQLRFERRRETARAAL